MAMPMTGMPASGWKAEGLLGGLYGGMQAQYQSDAMRDATRAAELDHAIKQYELRQKIADEPAVEAERAARITRANEFNTLSPTRIEDAQTSLEDKKYSSEQRKKVDKLADAAEFFASTSEAMKQAATDPEGGGRLSPGYRALWKQYQDEAKARGLDIGDEWSLENEQKLHNRGLKAQNSLKHIQQLQTIIAQGNQQERVASGNRASEESNVTRKLASQEREGAADRQNRLDVANIHKDQAAATAAARSGWKPKNLVELLQYRQTQGEQLNPVEQRLVDNAELISVYKALNPMANPDVKLASLAAAANDPDPVKRAAAEKEFNDTLAGVVSSARAAINKSKGEASAPTQPVAPTTPTVPAAPPVVKKDGWSISRVDQIPQ